MEKILVTGAAGFIGFHLCVRLLQRGVQVVGIDNLNSYYDPTLKMARLEQLNATAGFTFERMDITDTDAISTLFRTGSFDRVAHLAAQAGVRYSLENPRAYLDSNVVGFGNILEGCRHTNIKHLVYASSSSVYGGNSTLPFSVHDNVDHPLSFYAATKKANELMAHAYSHLYDLPTTGLRFFTVYGPWGRPDMAIFIFTRAILRGEPIDVFNHGLMQRDFTYVDDIVEGVVRTLYHTAASDPAWPARRPDPATSNAPYRVYNIGNSAPIELMRLIQVLEDALGRKAQLNLLGMQAGDVPATFAAVDDLQRDVGFAPSTPIEVGIKYFVEWYTRYFNIE